MLVDCDSCPVRGQHCAGCVVSTLFGEAPALPEGDHAHRRALEVLAGAGFEVTVLASDATTALARPAHHGRDGPDRAPALRLISAPRRRGHAA